MTNGVRILNVLARAGSNERGAEGQSPSVTFYPQALKKHSRWVHGLRTSSFRGLLSGFGEELVQGRPVLQRVLHMGLELRKSLQVLHLQLSMNTLENAACII